MGTTFDSLDLPGRAAALGLSCREVVELAESDPRIFAGPSTLGSVHRLCVWLGAGRPRADPSAIAFHGHDAVRAVVIATLSPFPLPVLWWLVEHALVIEVGRGNTAGRHVAPLRRRGHLIMLHGVCGDDVIPQVLAHECGHFWVSRPSVETDEAARKAAAAPAESEQERNARSLLAARMYGKDALSLAREMFAEEHRANEWARIWGHRCDRMCPDTKRLQGFIDEVTAASALADEIESQIDADIAKRAPEVEAQIAARLAAAATLPIEGTPP